MEEVKFLYDIVHWIREVVSTAFVIGCAILVWALLKVVNKEKK